jgi:hypothetical protein
VRASVATACVRTQNENEIDHGTAVKCRCSVHNSVGNRIFRIGVGRWFIKCGR